MVGLWRWDVDAFRAIHVAGRGLIADPFLQTITNMGLAHVHAMPLLIAALRPRVPAWVTGTSIAAAIAISFLAESRGMAGASALCCCLILFWRLPSRAALGAFFAGLFSGLLRIGVEALVNRERPSNLAFANPLEPVFSHSSFPSGHAATSMGVAVFLLWALHDDDVNRWLAYAATGWAVLVGLSRIAAGVHYPLDVLAGFALALAASTFFWLWWEKRGWMREVIEKGVSPEEVE